MHVRTVVNRSDIGTEASPSTWTEATWTQYGFTGDLEAMTAAGVLDFMREREFAERDVFFSSYRKRQIEPDTMRATDLITLRRAVQNLYAPSNEFSRFGRSKPLLHTDESKHMLTALSWATRPEQILAAQESRDGFIGVVAGAIILKRSLVDISKVAYDAAVSLLNGDAVQSSKLTKSGLVTVSHAPTPVLDAPNEVTVWASGPGLEA